MATGNTKQKMKKGAALLSLALAVALPFTTLAETTTQTAPAADTTSSATTPARMNGRGGHGYALGGYSVDVSALTQEQKAAYDSAVSLYEQVEDAVLLDLVAANVVAQADVDAYTALRTANKTLSEIDQTSWTAQQYKAYYEANQMTGDERKAAMQALADAGQFTQAQADALSAQGETGLWATIAQNAGTNSTIQTAISTMQQARKTLNNALSDAGITGTGKGMMMNGSGMGGKDFGGNFGRDSDSNAG